MNKFYAGLTNLEIMGIAISSENDAAGFYRKVSDRIENPMVKAKFKALASDEGKHAELLTEEYLRLSDGDAPKLPAGWKIETPLEFDKTASVEDILKKAIDMEKRAQGTYRYAAGRSSDPKARIMLEYLVEFERGHQRMLEAEMKFLKQNPEWFEQPWHHVHVGP